MSESQSEAVTQTSEGELTATGEVAEVKPTIIEANNPTAEEMAVILENLKVNYNHSVNTKQIQFNFKKTVDKVSGLETVRQSVLLAMPYPSVDGIVSILEAGEKPLELLLEAMEGVVNAAARDLLNDDEIGTTLNAANFPVEKLSWAFIANLPKSQRRGGGIPKETWEAFAADYVEVMPAVTGKTLDQVSNAAKILLTKLAAVKTNEAVLQLLVEQLALYSDNSPNVEDYQECVAFLIGKANTLLNVSDEELLANL
jgi:hypothetical protein